MAKKRRRLERQSTASDQVPETLQAGSIAESAAHFGLAFIVVISLLIPCDSTAVEQGYGVFFPLIAIPMATAAFYLSPVGLKSGRRLEAIFGCLVFWIGASALSVIGRGNFRHALNEFWVWMTMLVVFATARRVIRNRRQSYAIHVVLLVTIVALAIHAVHQNVISIPESIEAYQANPEAELKKAGIHAPPGTSVRMQYEGRLFAAESMATFSLSTSAAIMFLVGSALSIGLILSLFQSNSSFVTKASVGFGTLICVAGLLTTGSKIVLLIFLIMLPLSGLVKFMPIIFESSKIRTCFALAFSLCSVSVVFVGSWVSTTAYSLSLPDSIRYRFEYWCSTLSMIGDNLLFGAGPGNFQSLYPRYKFESASEVIADPHNWLLETTASAGLPGGLLAVVLVLGICFAAGRRIENREPSAGENELSVNSVNLGALSAVLIVWTLGLVWGVAPELEPYLLGLPLSVFVAYQLRSVRVDTTKSRWFAVFGVLAVLVWTGGWTVPGIAIPFWALLGLQVSDCEYLTSDDTSWLEKSGKLRKPCLVLGAVGFVLFSWTTLNPVVTSAVLIQAAQAERAGGNSKRALQFAELAVKRDSWNSENLKTVVAIEADEFFRGSAVAGSLEGWTKRIEELRSCEPCNPRMTQFVADLQLYVFQRIRDRSLLTSALANYEDIVLQDPSSTRAFAQIAIMLQFLGHAQEADHAWSRAKELLEVNGNSDSQWNVLLVWPVSANQSDEGRITVEQAWMNR